MTAIAWTGSSVVISSRGYSGNILYWWQAADTGPAWNPPGGEGELVATGLFGQPAMAWTGTSVVIAAVDNMGNLKYWWQKADTAAWNPPGGEGELVGTGLSGPPAIAWTGASVVIAAVDNMGNLKYWWQKADTGPAWNPSGGELVGTGLSGSPAIACATNAEGGLESVVIAAVDNKGNLKYWYQKGDTAGWNPPGGELVATGQSGQPAIAWTGTSVVIAAVDNMGNLNYWWQAADTGPAWNPPGGELVASGNWVGPAIAWTGTPPPPPPAPPSVVIAAAEATGKNLSYWWQAAGTAAWTPPREGNKWRLGCSDSRRLRGPALPWSLPPWMVRTTSITGGRRPAPRTGTTRKWPI